MITFKILFHPKNKGAVTASCLDKMCLDEVMDIVEYLDIQDAIESEWEKSNK